MDIPNRSSPSNNDSVPRIRNLHPSHMSPDANDSAHYGATLDTSHGIEERLSENSLSERIGSFVGSYSRTSMMFMAENVAVPSSTISTSPPTHHHNPYRLVCRCLRLDFSGLFTQINVFLNHVIIQL